MMSFEGLMLVSRNRSMKGNIVEHDKEGTPDTHLTNDHTIGYRTGDSASNSKFHHMALLVALVSCSSNCHH